jgi:hypothetical protein
MHFVRERKIAAGNRGPFPARKLPGLRHQNDALYFKETQFYLPPIQGRQQIEIQENLRASLNRWEEQEPLHLAFDLMRKPWQTTFLLRVHVARPHIMVRLEDE